MIFNYPTCKRVFSPFAAPRGCLCPDCGEDCIYQAEIYADESRDQGDRGACDHEDDDLAERLLASNDAEWEYAPDFSTPSPAEDCND